MSIPTSQRKVLLCCLRCSTLTKAASLRGEAFKSPVLVNCPETSITVCCSNYIDHDTTYILEDVNVPVNWILTTHQQEPCVTSHPLKRLKTCHMEFRFNVAASQFLFPTVSRPDVGSTDSLTMIICSLYEHYYYCGGGGGGASSSNSNGKSINIFL